MYIYIYIYIYIYTHICLYNVCIYIYIYIYTHCIGNRCSGRRDPSETVHGMRTQLIRLVVVIVVLAIVVGLVIVVIVVRAWLWKHASDRKRRVITIMCVHCRSMLPQTLRNERASNTTRTFTTNGITSICIITCIIIIIVTMTRAPALAGLEGPENDARKPMLWKKRPVRNGALDANITNSDMISNSTICNSNRTSNRSNNKHKNPGPV